MFAKLFIMFVICFLATVIVVDGWAEIHTKDKCQKIVVPLCQTNASKYDQTRLPNFIKFTNQMQVKTLTDRKELQDLVKTKCSKDFVFFVCSVLLPICITDSEEANIQNMIIPPCRSLCENVYNDCIQSIEKLNITWPSYLNCSGLLDHDEGVCITPDAFVTPTPKPLQLTASCSAKSQRNSKRKAKKFTQSSLSKYDYILRVKYTGKKSGARKRQVIDVISKSRCTSSKIPHITEIILDKASCTKKYKKSGEILIFAKKRRKDFDILIDKFITNLNKANMDKIFKKHCPSKKKNNKRKSGN